MPTGSFSKTIIFTENNTTHSLSVVSDFFFSNSFSSFCSRSFFEIWRARFWQMKIDCCRCYRRCYCWTVFCFSFIHYIQRTHIFPFPFESLSMNASNRRIRIRYERDVFIFCASTASWLIILFGGRFALCFSCGFCMSQPLKLIVDRVIVGIGKIVDCFFFYFRFHEYPTDIHFICM